MLERVGEGMESIGRTYLLRNDDIVMVGALLLFVLFTFVLSRSSTLILYKFNTFFSSRQIYASNEIRTSVQEQLDMVLLVFIGCLSVSTILYSCVISAVHSGPQYGLLLQIFLSLSALIVFKWILYSVVNWTFFSVDQGRSWISSVLFTVAVVSIIAFPLSLVHIFCDKTLLDIPFCLAIVVILQKFLLLLKLYVNFRPRTCGGVLFFLYFCSVEMMPTLVVWHILKDTILKQ